MLGTLRTGQGYVGLGDNGAGQVAAVVSQTGNTFNPFSSPCINGCLVQIIDVASRTIKQQATYSAANLAAVVRMTIDSECGDVIVGYSKTNGSGPPTSVSGYRVDAVGF